MNDFLSGIQVGANLYSQAKQLQEARARSMLAAREMMVNMQAARALDAYRQQQIAIQRAQEARQQAEFQQQQNIEQERRAFVTGIPQMRQDFISAYNPTPEQLESYDEGVNRDYMMRFAPSGVPSYLGSQETTSRYMSREERMREQFNQSQERLREEFNRKLEETKASREQRAETAESDREAKLKQSTIQAQTRLIAQIRKSLDAARSDLIKDPARISSLETELADAEAELDSIRGYKSPSGSLAPVRSDIIPEGVVIRRVK